MKRKLIALLTALALLTGPVLAVGTTETEVPEDTIDAPVETEADTEADAQVETQVDAGADAEAEPPIT